MCLRSIPTKRVRVCEERRLLLSYDLGQKFGVLKFKPHILLNSFLDLVLGFPAFPLNAFDGRSIRASISIDDFHIPVLLRQQILTLASC